MLERRAEPVIRALEDPESAVLLIGEAGSGKAYIAEHASNSMRDHGGIRTFVLSSPSGLTGPTATPEMIFGEAFPQAFPLRAADAEPSAPGAFEASRIALRLLAAIASEARGSEAMLVLPGIDHYTPLAAAVLEHVVRSRELRVLATAHRLVAGASLMSRDPRVARITIGPLDLEEADAFLSHLIGVSRIAPETLHRWHTATGGNSYALTMLLLASERRGVLRRRPGLAWVPAGLDEVPDEFVEYLDRVCSPTERETLEVIALSEPLVEPPLLRLLDPVATSSLLERGIISSRRSQGGQTSLSVTRPILATAIRNRMTPQRRMQIAGDCFDALDVEPLDSGLSHLPQDLVSRVTFGLEAGRPVPHEWLVRALSTLSLGSDPQLVLRVALALARGFASEDAAAAALRAVSFSTLLSDASALDAARTVIDDLLADELACERLPAALRVRLNLVQIEHGFRLGASMDDVLAQLDRLDASLEPDDAVSREEVRCARFQVILESGDLAAAYEARIDDEVSDDITIEWVRASARSGVSLILLQQGRLEEGIRVAERARTLAQMGKRPLSDTSEMQSLCWFLGYWASGSVAGGNRVLDEVESQAPACPPSGVQPSGFALEVARAMIALQEARWRDAADLSELLAERLETTDPHGIMPLLGAVQALALAVLGEYEEAVRALHRARSERRGFSQAVAGFTRRIAVQAQQWLRVGDPGAEALALAEWANGQGLGLIELEALHLAALESTAHATRARFRARELAIEADPLVGDVILAHIEKIAEGVSPSDVSEPETRLLADLGLWTPLPKTSGLSAREREVALFASLGYSSRFIAERLYLSVRTVETHLAHVYAKLGIADREDLRRWFSVDRAVEDRSFIA